jgi:large-conductance mechanosensitive channel
MTHRKRICVVGILAVITGIVIAYISGFFPPLILRKTVDVLQWGSPFPYIHRVVTFYTAPFVDWTMALVDFVIWAVLVFLVLYFGWASRTPGKQRVEETKAEEKK